MKVRVHLRVGAQEFFEALEESVAYDAEQARGKKVPVSKLREGFSYRKELSTKMGGTRKVTTRITTFEPPYAYAVSVTSSEGVNTVSYTIEPAEDGASIDVLYEEGFSSDKAMTDLNNKLMGGVFGTLVGKRRIKQQLRQMEAYIRSNLSGTRDQAASPDHPDESARAEESED